MASQPNVEYLKRADGRWGWHVQAANGEIVATDGGQGYGSERDARRGFEAAASAVFALALAAVRDAA